MKKLIALLVCVMFISAPISACASDEAQKQDEAATVQATEAAGQATTEAAPASATQEEQKPAEEASATPAETPVDPSATK